MGGGGNKKKWHASLSQNDRSKGALTRPGSFVVPTIKGLRKKLRTELNKGGGDVGGRRGKRRGE